MHSQRRIAQLVDIAAHGRENVAPRHIEHGQRFDIQHLAVILQMDFVTRLHLGSGVDTVLREQGNVFLGQIVRQTLRRGAQIQQAALFRLGDPRIVIAVAVEDDALVRVNGLADERLQVGFKVRAALQHVGKLAEALGHGGVQHDVDAGNGGGRTGHAELKLVAGKGKRRRAVAVRGVARKARQRVHADLQQLFFMAGVIRIVLQRFEDLLQLRTDVHGNDGRRRFVRAQTVVVRGGGYADAQHILIIVHGLNDRAEEQQKLGVLRRGLARLQKVHAGIRAQRPVVVLAAAVHAGKRLFMQQADHPVAGGDLLHRLHRELVVVGRNVSGRKDRRQFMLRGRNLVVLGLGQHADLPKLLIQLLHERGDAGLDATEIMVVQLLPLRRLCAEERAPGVDQIPALVINALVDEEIFLLRADRGAHGSDVRMPKQPQNAQRLPVQRLHAAQQRGLFIQGLAAIGAKRRRDAEHAVFDESVGGRIPRGVAARLKRGAQAAGRKAGCVRLAADELLAGKLHNDLTVVHRGNEAVVLLRCDAGHGLEPVGKMRRALFDRPILHGIGHDARGFVVEALSVLDRVANLLVGLLRQTFLHHRIAKYHRAENIRYLLHSEKLLLKRKKRH